jgi:hypothetical protein
VFRRHCANSAPVPVILYAAETLIDFSHALLSVERMHRRPKASCHHPRKVDFRQVAQRSRTEAARLESPSIIWDTRLKEYTTGTPHELTDRLFLVRRALRANDALPTESASAKATRWQWQRGGWLLVDRVTGRVSQLNLPEFDPFYSTASWYRDYIAYCGVSEDGKKLYAVVAQVGRRKPILKKDAGEPAGTE